MTVDHPNPTLVLLSQFLVAIVYAAAALLDSLDRCLLKVPPTLLYQHLILSLQKPSLQGRFMRLVRRVLLLPQSQTYHQQYIQYLAHDQACHEVSPDGRGKALSVVRR